MDNVFFGKGEKNAEGVSTRKVTQITEQLCGTEISVTQVSRIAKLLDEELEQFRERGAPGVPGGVPGCPLREGESSRAVFPSVPWQRCQFHLAQNAQAHAHNRAQGRKIGQAIRDIFNCPSLADAEAILTRVAERFAKENLQWVKWLERRLPSGDSLDVSFESSQRWTAVEVKSAKSDKADYARGVFQCVKYEAVMEAELVSKASRKKDFEVKAILVVEGKLDPDLWSLANTLGVCAREVPVGIYRK